MNNSQPSRSDIERLAPVEMVLFFFNNVWSSPYNVDLIDILMTEDFTITNAGVELNGREQFKQWVKGFLQTVDNANIETVDIFESKDGTKVVSRWKLTGLHNGMFGLEPSKKPIYLQGTAVWLIRDNKLAHNWVERNAWEVYQQLTSPEQ